MSVIFGVFENRESATAAITAIERQTGSTIDAVVHEDHFRDEDVQMGATSALRGALLGAAVVGVVGALVGGLLLIPNADLSIGWTEFVFLAIAGTIMGVTAGAVAGASETRDELRRMTSWLEKGKVLVTVETDERVPDNLAALFTANGAVEVAAA